MRSGRRRVFEFLSTWRHNVAQIKRPLYRRMFQAFPHIPEESSGAVAGLPQRRKALLLGRRCGCGVGVVEVAEEIRIGAEDHGPTGPESLLVGLHAPPEAIEILIPGEGVGVDL